MWHGLPARENTAKMAVPPIKQLRLNTYPAKAGIQKRIDAMDSRFRGNDKLCYVFFTATLTAVFGSKPVSLSK